LSVYDERSPTVAKDNKLIIIGTGVVFFRKVIEADNVKLERTADGEITEKTVEISSAGTLDGNVRCNALIVAGTFSREATVASSLSVLSSAQVTAPGVVSVLLIGIAGMAASGVVAA
jgi:cytoskeletal protein CcmA (bactofilin family)